MQKPVLKEKAYKINFDKIQDGFLYSKKTCIAESLNQAKQILLKEVRYEDMMLSRDEELLTYMNIPVVRCPEYDLVVHRGEVVRRGDIEAIEEEIKNQAELNSIKDNPKIEYCYIKKGGLYYRAESRGYTEYIKYAGVYEKLDAIKSALHCRDLKVVPIDIKEHNIMITQAIRELSRNHIDTNKTNPEK